ncbi:uncharacterized protein [Triticum aestivum]|uniref:uncharacterized protein n=1 Tax=Triticum aestivum TaxID=4565 RepID=UPI001D02D796|nr:uncharacterized protein LOC123113138 [Triticum aestivum]
MPKWDKSEQEMQAAQVTPGPWKEKLYYFRPKALKQAPRTEVCAYYVYENIRMMASERTKSDRQLWFNVVRETLLPKERIRALQEEIAGFLLDQVIDPKGEYYYPLPPL